MGNLKRNGPRPLRNGCRIRSLKRESSVPCCTYRVRSWSSRCCRVSATADCHATGIPGCYDVFNLERWTCVCPVREISCAANIFGTWRDSTSCMSWRPVSCNLHCNLCQLNERVCGKPRACIQKRNPSGSLTIGFRNVCYFADLSSKRDGLLSTLS